MKPTLILNHGVGWAATSPLIYTLQRLTKHCHNGHCKKTNYLYLIGGDHRECLTAAIKYLKPKVLNNTWENFEPNIGHKMNLPEDLQPIRDFPLDLFEDFATPPYTIDKYVRYYNKLWEIVEPQGYKAISDFTPYVYTPHLKQPLTEIQKYFNVKSIIIVRDPIRRAFSHSLSHDARNIPRTVDELIHCYVENYDQIKSINPNTIMVVMEELWEGTGKELKKLESFLGTSIPELWINGYSPDRGHLIKDTDGTPCQITGQSDKPLTPELYQYYRKKYSYIYDNWKKRYGILPRQWGRPIDYEKNYITK